MEEEDTSQRNSFALLPQELFFFILNKLNGRDLKCASKVNQRWQNAVESLGTYYNIWYKKCMEDIGVESIVKMTGLTQLLTDQGRIEAGQRREEWTFWKELYDLGCQIKLKDHSCDSESDIEPSNILLFSKNVQIIAAALGTHLTLTAGCYSNQLVLVNEGGDIQFHNIGTDWRMSKIRSNTKPFSKSFEQFKDMKAITIGGCQGFPDKGARLETYFLCSGIKGSLVIFNWDGSCREELIFPRISHQCYQISVLGPFFTVGNDSAVTRGLLVYKLVPNPYNTFDLPIAVPIIKLRGVMHPAVCAVALSCNQVAAGSPQGALYVWNIPPLSDFEDVQPSHRMWDSSPIVIDPKHTAQLRSAVEQVAIHNGNVIMVLSNGNMPVLAIKDNEASMYMIDKNIINRLFRGSYTGFSIKTMAVLGNALAVTSSSGIMILFDIHSKEWFKSLRDSCVRVIDTVVPLMHSLTFNYSHQGLALMCFGRYTVRVLKWKTLDQTNQEKGESTCAVRCPIDSCILEMRKAGFS